MEESNNNSEDGSTVPSVDSTEHDDDNSSSPPFEEIVDRSNEPGAEQKATSLKDQANKELAAGHFLQAIELYSQGLEYSPTNSILLSNRALAYIKVENYGLALHDADRAIESDPTYVKGYYRRASANYALNHFKVSFCGF